MNSKYSAVIFDLDGTLLNTLGDLADSVNYCMRRFGFLQHKESVIQSFVGNGIRALVARSVPGGEDNPRFEEILNCFKEYYDTHCDVRTVPYPGVINLLKMLKADGIGTAIVSNKADSAVKKLNERYFNGLIDVAIGENEKNRKKPAPDSVYEALRVLNVPGVRALYAGDSEVDAFTAQNAGLDLALVTWGFRTREQMKECVPRVWIDDPSQLHMWLKGQNADPAIR